MRIRYFGHMGEPTGYGVAAERYCEALSERSDVELDEVNINTLERRVNSLIAPPDAGYLDCTGVDAVIVHTLPRDCRRFWERLRDVPLNCAIVAYTTWEALTMNSEIAMELATAFDEVWMPSEASAKAMRGALEQWQPNCFADNPYVIPHCYRPYDTRPPIMNLRSDTTFRFYWIGAWNARKNPSGVIRAFAHAFSSKDDVELYLHSHGTPIEALVAELAATGLPAFTGDESPEKLPRIRLNNEYLDDDKMAALHMRGDCFVTAARGEAWNLPCFEALCHRKQIISPAKLGSDDFLVDTDAYLVTARPTPAWNTLSRTVSAGGEVGAHILGAQGLTSRDLWLEPDLVTMAGYMRDAYERGVGFETRIDYSLAERYSYAPVAQMILNRLEALR